ncbi:hypothetical protein QBC40DRAFT_261944 [Triangularia verruculosa]|uniref:G-patch domain-containing protein n=1 Tax=Triangularia verruculosa TaxID=2587418 RepID=A0AAN7AWR8_9PEZI|nr:hypothetical protein QBC40DRAFT_261944 [Triangularia verruculosa]
MSRPIETHPIGPFDETDDIPLQHKRPFGSGLYKKTIAFVPASSSLKTVADNDTPTTTTPSVSISDLYLSMVLPSSPPPPPPPPTPTPSNQNSSNPQEQQPPLCPSCSLPLTPSHPTSLTHQLSLPHSHPPSSLNRSRMGLQHLTSLGWDPDSRLGLGSHYQGIQHPIKPKPKANRLGLGVEIPKGLRSKPPPPKEKLLDAKKVRKQYDRDRKKKQNILKELYTDNKLAKYLGPGTG